MAKQTKPKWAISSFSLFSASLDRRLRRPNSSEPTAGCVLALLPFSPKRPCASFLCLCLLLVVCRSALLPFSSRLPNPNPPSLFSFPCHPPSFVAFILHPTLPPFLHSKQVPVSLFQLFTLLSILSSPSLARFSPLRNQPTSYRPPNESPRISHRPDTFSLSNKNNTTPAE